MSFKCYLVRYLIIFCLLATSLKAQTIALWLFDEQAGLYPSSVLCDYSDNDYPMVIGPGGMIVPGKFGNALDAVPQPPVSYPEGEEIFGLKKLPIPEGRTIEPMTWMNANFCGLMTMGENHLRKEVDFVNPTCSQLNLGQFDWTVEFWMKSLRRLEQDGVIFEVGRGPRGENQERTRLVVDKELKGFRLFNTSAQTDLFISSDPNALDPEKNAWHHFALVYDAIRGKLMQFVDGQLLTTLEEVSIQTLTKGEEAYMSVGRNGEWNEPLPGPIDELHFYAGKKYMSSFTPPTSYSPLYNGTIQPPELVKGPPLLFAQAGEEKLPVVIADRKHLFIDDALVSKMENILFTVNPPRLAERVIEGIKGPFRKHLTVVEDEQGVLRIYNSVHDDYLAVRTSHDGIHWEIPDIGKGEYRGNKNIVIFDEVGGLGNPFVDMNGPAVHRWKYLTDYNRRGIFLYTSPDGYNWKRFKIMVLPFRSGTQSCTFYDDQQQLYVSYHRTGITHTLAGATERRSVLTETADLFQPVPFQPLTANDYRKAAMTMRLREPLPWYLDNGPLTPGGFGIEYPHKFVPIDTLDPPEFDMYVTKAMKYPWAPDTYLAFPIAYFHYEIDTPLTRLILMDPRRGRGSGPIETQLSVSRDGVNWKRYPRPAYIGNGLHGGWPVNQAYIAHGMVRRGDEIWQYYFGTEIYHSSWNKDESCSAVYRVVQRLDGFVSADTPYQQEGYLTTKPLVFKGNRLVLNIDTDATGYAQVGFLDQQGKPIEGFSVDDCIYINGDFINTEVEWLNKGKDVTELAGKTVQLLFRMRGTKLYAMQFMNK